MFDTMTVTKAAGALFAMWLILLLGKWAAETLYHVGGHGEQAYVIPVEESAPADDGADAVPFEEIYAAADAAAGEGLFRACQSCHKLDGSNGTGPHLDGVVGRPVGSVDGFGYSEALLSLGGEWTPDRLAEFLASPKGYANGTKMSYAGMKKVEDRANLIAYLASTGG